MIPADKVFWTASEAADALGISIGHLYNEKCAGRIGYVQRGPNCRLRFRREHLEAYAAGGDALVDSATAWRGRRATPVPRAVSARHTRRP